jgi:hypothetical protein
VVTILPLNPVDVDQPEVGLIDQGAGLEAMACPLTGHATSSDAMKLMMHEWNELVQRGQISAAPCEE